MVSGWLQEVGFDFTISEGVGKVDEEMDEERWRNRILEIYELFVLLCEDLSLEAFFSLFLKTTSSKYGTVYNIMISCYKSYKGRASS